jgi:hypothetical protein
MERRAGGSLSWSDRAAALPDAEQRGDEPKGRCGGWLREEVVGGFGGREKVDLGRVVRWVRVGRLVAVGTRAGVRWQAGWWAVCAVAHHIADIYYAIDTRSTVAHQI